MKKVKRLISVMAVLLLLSACAKADDSEIKQTEAVTSATQETEEGTETDTDMTSNQEVNDNAGVLVAYFSRAGENYNVGVVEKGNTEIVAEMIAQETGANLFKIQTVEGYPESYEECTDVAKEEKEENARPELSNTIDDISEYDVIYLGYPIWWGDMPMAVYTFLESYDFSGKTIIPFCTHAGSGLAGTVESIKGICARASVSDGLAITGETAQNDPEAARDAVRGFLGTK